MCYNSKLRQLYITLTRGLGKGGGFILYLFYAHQNTQHVSSEIIEPKQQHYRVIIKDAFLGILSTLIGSGLGDSDLIEFTFLAGWWLIPVSGSVGFVYSHWIF